MKKLLLILSMMALTACCAKANAEVTINTSGLTEAQKAQLVQQAEQMKQAEKGDIISTSTVEKWANFTEVFGKAISTTAKEIGVQANEFVTTPVGKMTAAVIIYRYVGKDLISAVIHIISGLLVIGIGIYWTFRIVTSSRQVTIEYDETTKNIFGNYVVKSIKKSTVSGDTLASTSIFLVASVFGGIMLIVTAI